MRPTKIRACPSAMFTAPTGRRQRRCLAFAAVAGMLLLAWAVFSAGPRELVSQLRSLGSVLPLMLVLAAVRFLFQAAGWRLALPRAERPAWHEAFTAVVAGEAAGYFAWGPFSREPIKALLVNHRAPERKAFAAAVVERSVYTIAATMLFVAGVGIAAAQHDYFGWFVIGLAVTTVVLFVMRRCWWRLRTRESTLSPHPIRLGILAYGLAQEVIYVLEAYVVLMWLGALPTLASVVALEGLSRLINGPAQFIPVRLGVTEAATAALAEGLRLGSAHGLSLALARRARSLAWGAVGIGLVTFLAVNRTLAGSREEALAIA